MSWIDPVSLLARVFPSYLPLLVNGQLYQAPPAFGLARVGYIGVMVRSRLAKGILVTMALAACSSQGGLQAGKSQTDLRMTGALQARFSGASDQKCSTIASAGGAESKQSFLFNGAQSSSQPTYILLFSIFPYEGPRTYDLSPSTGTKVLVANPAGEPDQQQLEGTKGKVVIKSASKGRASGSLQAVLDRPGITIDLPDAADSINLEGKWACSYEVSPSP